MLASTTSAISTIVGSVISEGTTAVTSIFTSYIGVFMTLTVGVVIIGAVVRLFKSAPRKVFGGK